MQFQHRSYTNENSKKLRREAIRNVARITGLVGYIIVFVTLNFVTISSWIVVKRKAATFDEWCRAEIELVIRPDIGTSMMTQDAKMGANATAFHTNAKKVEDRTG